MRVVLVALTVLSPVGVLAQPLGPNWRGLLTPYHPNFYGPDIISDGTGRQFSSLPLSGNGAAKPNGNVSTDARGPGIELNQDGRLVQPVAPKGE